MWSRDHGRTGAVLHKSSDKVSHCHQRAAEARERGMRATNVSVKAMWFKLEDRWTALAHSWAMAEAFDDFDAEVRRVIGHHGERH